MATKAISAAVLNGLGDIMAQYFFKDGEKFDIDFKRLGIFSFIVSILSSFFLFKKATIYIHNF